MSETSIVIDPIRLATFDAARSAVASGLSLIPILGDGTKRPAWHLLPFIWNEECQAMKHQWRLYESRYPTLDEITYWFLVPRLGPPCGFAILGGAISGGLEVIDFDVAELFDGWAARIRQTRPGLLETLTIVRSPRPGIHVYFRSASAGPSRKLAQRNEVDQTTGRPKLRTLIEVKAQGGYVLAPGCPSWCHPTGRCYEFVTSGGFVAIPTVNLDDRNLMLVEAMRLTEVAVTRTSTIIRPVRAPTSNRPGDLFAAVTSWSSILEPHGWVCAGGNNSAMAYWRRPGKSESHSATTNHAGTDLLRVFSENAAPFETGQSYSKFAAHALLNYGGDFGATATALVAQGFACRSVEQTASHWTRRRPGQRRVQT